MSILRLPPRLDLGDLRILIIDDSRTMRRILRQVLDGFGILNVTEAESAEVAFGCLGDPRPDIIITDWVMEGASGIEFVKRLRADENQLISTIPVIMLTSYSERSRVVAGIYSGIHDFVTKPLVPRQLYARIVDIIERPRPFLKGPGFFGPEPRSEGFFDLVEAERAAKPYVFCEERPEKSRADSAQPPDETDRFFL